MFVFIIIHITRVRRCKCK